MKKVLILSLILLSTLPTYTWPDWMKKTDKTLGPDKSSLHWSDWIYRRIGSNGKEYNKFIAEWSKNGEERVKSGIVKMARAISTIAAAADQVYTKGKSASEELCKKVLKAKEELSSSFGSLPAEQRALRDLVAKKDFFSEIAERITKLPKSINIDDLPQKKPAQLTLAPQLPQKSKQSSGHNTVDSSARGVVGPLPSAQSQPAIGQNVSRLKSGEDRVIALPWTESQSAQSPRAIGQDVPRLESGKEKEGVVALPWKESQSSQSQRAIGREVPRLEFGKEKEGVVAVPRTKSQSSQSQPAIGQNVPRLEFGKEKEGVVAVPRTKSQSAITAKTSDQWDVTSTGISIDSPLLEYEGKKYTLGEGLGVIDPSKSILKPSDLTTLTEKNLEKARHNMVLIFHPDKGGSTEEWNQYMSLLEQMRNIIRRGASFSPSSSQLQRVNGREVPRIESGKEKQGVVAA